MYVFLSYCVCLCEAVADMCVNIAILPKENKSNVLARVDGWTSRWLLSRLLVHEADDR